jgi:hypothetical protein
LILKAYQVMVSSSFSASDFADFKKSSTACSFPGLAA